MLTTQILLISANETLALELTDWLTKNPDFALAGRCTTLLAAVECCTSAGANALLVDFGVSDSNNETAWLALKQTFPHAPIVALSNSTNEPNMRQLAQQAGARCLVRSDNNDAELFASLHNALTQELDNTQREPTESLSEPEREVLALIAQGMTNKEIAERLCLSIHTVKHRITGILSKLDVSTRTQAAIWAREHGLIKVHDDQSKK